MLTTTIRNVESKGNDEVTDIMAQRYITFPDMLFKPISDDNNTPQTGKERLLISTLSKMEVIVLMKLLMIRLKNLPKNWEYTEKDIINPIKYNWETIFTIPINRKRESNFHGPIKEALLTLSKMGFVRQTTSGKFTPYISDAPKSDTDAPKSDTDAPKSDTDEKRHAPKSDTDGTKSDIDKKDDGTKSDTDVTKLITLLKMRFIQQTTSGKFTPYVSDVSKSDTVVTKTDTDVSKSGTDELGGA